MPVPACPPAALSEIEFPRCSCVWVYAVHFHHCLCGTDKWVVVVGVVAIAELGALLLPFPSLPPTDK